MPEDFRSRVAKGFNYRRPVYKLPKTLYYYLFLEAKRYKGLKFSGDITLLTFHAVLR